MLFSSSISIADLTPTVFEDNIEAAKVSGHA